MSVAGGPLHGVVAPPGDKSVTHRALMLGAVADGETVIAGALDALDTRSTATCLTALGARITWKPSSDVARIEGVATFESQSEALDCGNAGTAARLFMGLLAGRAGRVSLDGDASLRRRPMGRVARPLAELGASVDGERLPLTVGGDRLSGGQVATQVPSAQVKSALLLAGLVADAPLAVTEPVPTRDHTEAMLPAFGIGLERVDACTSIVTPGRPAGATLSVPGDPSAAAFVAVAALLTPGSDVTIENVGLWPRRCGWIDALQSAGAALSVGPAGAGGHDPVGDIRVEGSSLRAFEIAPEAVPDLVDELPILALAAGLAEGTSRFHGLAELRIKESDRVATIAALLADLGVPVAIDGDGLTITGVAALTGSPAAGHRDHRLALTSAVARHVMGASPVPEPAAAVSWPGFDAVLARLSRG